MRPTYAVHIWQEDGLWIAKVVSAGEGADTTPVGAVTEGRTWEEILSMARDLIATHLDADETDFDVTFSYPDAPASQPGFRTTKGFGYVEMDDDE